MLSDTGGLKTNSGRASVMPTIPNAFEQEFKKQTRLESHVTMLTIKRTMTCFFAIIFTVPFFIPTTYKSFLTEFIPISKMAEDIRTTSDQATYFNMLDFIVSKHKNDFDSLVGLAGVGYSWKSDEYADDKIRALNLISLKKNNLEFTVDLTNTMKLYAICGICGYVLAGKHFKVT